MSEWIIRLRDAFDRQYSKSCGFTAHSLKDVVELFGGDRAMKFAAEIEQLVKKPSPDMLTLTGELEILYYGKADREPIHSFICRRV